MVNPDLCYQYCPVSHKVLFWDHCYSSFALMMLQAYVILQAPILHICWWHAAVQMHSWEDVQYLQEDSDTTCHWVRDNHLALNSSKCKYMIVSRKQKQASTLLEGTPLEHADTFKYLGVILSSDLSWTPPQVESVCTKARKLLWLLYRRFHNNTGIVLHWNKHPSWTIHYACQTSPGIRNPCLVPFYSQ